VLLMTSEHLGQLEEGEEPCSRRTLFPLVTALTLSPVTGGFRAAMTEGVNLEGGAPRRCRTSGYRCECICNPDLRESRTTEACFVKLVHSKHHAHRTEVEAFSLLVTWNSCGPFDSEYSRSGQVRQLQHHQLTPFAVCRKTRRMPRWSSGVSY
jgi:hypothetical protein